MRKTQYVSPLMYSAFKRAQRLAWEGKQEQVPSDCQRALWAIAQIKSLAATDKERELKEDK